MAKNLVLVHSIMRCAIIHGTDVPLGDFARGPFPTADSMGMELAVYAIQRSLDEGINSNTIQFTTIRGQPAFASNFIHTTPVSNGLSTMMDGKKVTHYSPSPTNSIWFRAFMEGLHGRLGDVVLQDQALSIDELLALQSVLEEQWERAFGADDDDLMFEIATIGAVVCAGYAAALRGEELGHA